MLGAPLGRVSFPATDRPSATFLARFERALRAVPDDALGAPVVAALAGCVEGDLASCLASLGPVTRFAVVAVGTSRVLIGVPDGVVDALVEFAYGGDNSEAVTTPRALSPLGLRYAERAAALLVDAMALAFSGAEIRLAGMVDTPGDMVPLSTVTLACGFALEVRGEPLGAIGVFVPVRVLAELENSAGSVSDDAGWSDRLETAVAQARIEVRAVLARPKLTAGEVAQLAPGVVIPISSMSEVTLIANGYRIATGIADVREGRAAIVINRTEFA